MHYKILYSRFALYSVQIINSSTLKFFFSLDKRRERERERERERIMFHHLITMRVGLVQSGPHHHLVLWCVWIPSDVRCTITPDTHTEAGLNCTTTSRLRWCSTVKMYIFLILSKITRYQQKSTQWKFRTFKRLEVSLNRHVLLDISESK
jgi:hypothetical protein